MSGGYEMTRAESLPRGLQHVAVLPVWIAWGWGEPTTPGKSPRKRPITHGMDWGSYADPANWENYQTWFDSIAQKPPGKYSGVGISMHAVAAMRKTTWFRDDPNWLWADLLMIDIDHCRDAGTGVIADWAISIIEGCQSYAEISPSGTGVRIIGTAGPAWNPGERQRRWHLNHVGFGETFYSSGWATVTGWALPGFDTKWAVIGHEAVILETRREALDTGIDDQGEGREGKSPYAPIEVIRETLGYLPNDDAAACEWHHWNTVGMAIYRATSGSEDGLLAWRTWSERNPNHEIKDTCEDRWANFDLSPPDKLGYGKIHWWTQQAQLALGVTWNGGPEFVAYHESRRWGAAMGPIDGSNSLATGVPVAPDATGNPTAGTGTSANVAGPPPGGPGPTGPGPSVTLTAGSAKAVVSISGTSLDAVVILAEGALIAAGVPIYQRAGVLVRPIRELANSFEGESTFSSQFIEMKAPTLTFILAQHVQFQRFDMRAQRLINIDPPDKVVDLLINNRGKWRFPEVLGIATAPIIRPDGLVVCHAGYDPVSRVYLMPDPKLDFARIEAAVNRNLSRDDALAALAKLNGLLGEFPFIHEMDRAVALSAMLTPICRQLMRVAPLHAFNAPRAGTGKTYLAKLCASLSLGSPPPIFTAGGSEEELGKKVDTALLTGKPVIMIDNLNGVLKGDQVSTGIEQEYLQIRLLGQSKFVEIANWSCIMATGNNISTVEDNIRRVLMCILDPNVERPENRVFTGFPIETLLRDRTEYLIAAYVIIRAHAQFGFPGVRGLEPLGSFEAWTRYVRGALVWLGCADARDTTDRARDQDPDTGELHLLLRSWVKRFGLGEKGARTARDLAETHGIGAITAVSGEVNAMEEASHFRDVLLRIAGNRMGQVDVKSIGYWLRRHKGQVSEHLKLVKMNEKEHIGKWMVQSTVLSLVSGNG